MGHLPGNPGGQRDRDHDHAGADQAFAASQRGAGADDPAQGLRDGHREREAEIDGPGDREAHHGAEVGGEVGDLGVGGGLDEIVAEDRGEKDDEKGAGPGAEEAVVVPITRPIAEAVKTG